MTQTSLRHQILDLLADWSPQYLTGNEIAALLDQHTATINRQLATLTRQNAIITRKHGTTNRHWHPKVNFTPR